MEVVAVKAHRQVNAAMLTTATVVEFIVTDLGGELHGKIRRNRGFVWLACRLRDAT
jgi:hypothetical protein